MTSGAIRAGSSEPARTRRTARRPPPVSNRLLGARSALLRRAPGRIDAGRHAFHRKIRFVSHPLALALFPTASMAAEAAGALHALGITRESISVVAHSHDDERTLADRMDATPGVELEDSRPAARVGELSGQVLAAIALVMPGIGPIVTAGPLAAELGEAAGHAAGSLASVLTSAGLPHERAESLQREVAQGAVLLGVHLAPPDVDRVRESLSAAGATELEMVTWG
jgi:hypothetical protein